MNSRIFITLSLSLVLISLGLYRINLAQEQKRAEQERVKKETIKEGTLKIYADCTDISTFEKRRECFKEEMIRLRMENSKVSLRYDMTYSGTKEEVKTEDLGDLLRIEKPHIALERCVSNTFFFDWVEDSIYISMDNTLGSVRCMTPNGEIIFSPSNLTDEEKVILNAEFTNQFN